MHSSLLINSAMAKQIELLQKKQQDLINKMWYRAYRHQAFYCQNFFSRVLEILNSVDSGFSGYVSGTHIYIKSNKFGIYQGQSLKPDVAGVDLLKNSLHMRRKGAAMVTKVIKCDRDLTPERVAKYVLRFGMK